jgi:hypothetical protein
VDECAVAARTHFRSLTDRRQENAAASFLGFLLFLFGFGRADFLLPFQNFLGVVEQFDRLFQKRLELLVLFLEFIQVAHDRYSVTGGGGILPQSATALYQWNLPAEDFRFHIEELQAFLEAFVDSAALREPRIRHRFNPGGNDHHRQAAPIPIEVPDPPVQRPHLGGFHPPRRRVGQPQFRSIQVLKEPAAGSVRLTDVAQVPDIAGIRQKVNGRSSSKYPRVVVQMHADVAAKLLPDPCFSVDPSTHRS